jgi:CRP-like cAMP-binding protein
MEFQDDKVMTASPVPQKIARFLLRTVDSQAPIYGSRISLKLTRRDIAERVGTTVETVIRVLSKWSQQGWIRIEDQHIDILNREAFEDLLSEPN